MRPPLASTQLDARGSMPNGTTGKSQPKPQAETSRNGRPLLACRAQVALIYRLVDRSLNRRLGIDEPETVSFGVTIPDLVTDDTAERATTGGRAAEGHAAGNDCTVRQEQFITEKIGHRERSGGRTSILPCAVRNLAVVLRSVTDGEADRLVGGGCGLCERQGHCPPLPWDRWQRSLVTKARTDIARTYI